MAGGAPGPGVGGGGAEEPSREESPLSESTLVGRLSASKRMVMRTFSVKVVMAFSIRLLTVGYVSFNTAHTKEEAVPPNLSKYARVPVMMCCCSCPSWSGVYEPL